MEMAVGEGDLELDAGEEVGFRMENEAIGAGGELVGQLGDAPVGSGDARGHELGPLKELDEHAARRLAATGVEDMPENARPKKSAAKVTKTTPMPESSWTKS